MKQGQIVKVEPVLMSQRLEQMLEEKNITRRELAEKADIGYSNLSYMIQGHRERYTEHNLQQLADALGVTYGWLTGKDTTAPKYRLPDKVNAKAPELPGNNLFRNAETPEHPAPAKQVVNAKALVEAIRAVVREELGDVKKELNHIGLRVITIDEDLERQKDQEYIVRRRN